jgi:Ca-activated chloride channel homolog
MFFSPFHFLRPFWLWALIPALLLLWLLIQGLYKGGHWQEVCDEHLLPYLVTSTKKSLFKLPILFLGMAWILAILALAGPTWRFQPVPTFHIKEPLIVTFGLSPSLYATDMKPNRLKRAKYKIFDILGAHKEGETGMVVFSDEAYVVSPLTEDAKTIASLIPELEPNMMPTPGSRISLGLEKAKELLKQGQNPQQGTILLITDQIPEREDIKEARKLHQTGYIISVLALGSEEGTPIPTKANGFLTDDRGQVQLQKTDMAKLKELAQAGGGRFAIFSNNNEDIQKLLATSSFHSKTSEEKKTSLIWRDEGHWLILFILPLVLFAFRKSWFKEIIP